MKNSIYLNEQEEDNNKSCSSSDEEEHFSPTFSSLNQQTLAFDKRQINSQVDDQGNHIWYNIYYRS